MKCPINNTKERLQDIAHWASVKVGANELYHGGMRALVQLQDMMNKFSKAGKQFAATMLEAPKRSAEIWNNFTHNIDSYTGLVNKKLIDDILIQGDKESKRYSDAELRLKGLSSDEIKAYNDVRTSLDNILKESMSNKILLEKEGMEDKTALSPTEVAIKVVIDKEPKPENISSEDAQAIKQLQSHYREGFIPRYRRGTHYVKLTDQHGNTIYYEQYNLPPKNAKQATEAIIAKGQAYAAQLKAEGVSNAREAMQKTYDKTKFAVDEAGGWANYREKEITRLTKLIDKWGDRTNLNDRQLSRVSDAKLRLLNIDHYSPEAIKSRMNEIGTAKWEKDNSYGDISIESGVHNEDAFLKDMSVNSKEFQDFQAQLENSYMKSMSKVTDPEKRQLVTSLYESMKENFIRNSMANTSKRHQIKRREIRVEGYMTDVSEALSMYAHEISTATSKMELAMKVQKYISDMTKEDRYYLMPALKEAMRSQFLTDKLAQKVSGATYAMTFWGNLKSGIVNVYGMPIQAISVLIDRTGMGIKDSAKAVGYALKDAVAFQTAYAKQYYKANGIKNMGEFLDTYKGFSDELKADLKKGIMDGLTFDQFAQELGNAGSEKNPISRIMKLGMTPIAATEKTTRLASFIAAHRNADREISKGLTAMQDLANKGFITEATKEKFADFISGETNAIYSAPNRSGIERGEGGAIVRAIFPMQTYAKHALALYMRYAKSAYDIALKSKTMTPEERASALRGAKAFQVYTMGMLGAGGVTAVPLLDGANEIYKSMNDGVGFAEELKADGNPLGYGLAGMAGADLTGSLEAQVPYISGSLLKSKWGMAGNDASTAEKAWSMIEPSIVNNIYNAWTSADLKSKKTGTPITLNGEELARGVVEKAFKALGFQSVGISEAKMKILIDKALTRDIGLEKQNLKEDLMNGNLDYEDVVALDDKINSINEHYGIGLKAFNPTMPKPTNYQYRMED